MLCSFLHDVCLCCMRRFPHDVRLCCTKSPRSMSLLNMKDSLTAYVIFPHSVCVCCMFNSCRCCMSVVRVDSFTMSLLYVCCTSGFLHNVFLFAWLLFQRSFLRDVYMSMLYEWILSRKVCCCCVSVIRGDSFPMYVYLYNCCIRSFLYDVCLIYICCTMRFSRNVCLC